MLEKHGTKWWCNKCINSRVQTENAGQHLHSPQSQGAPIHVDAMSWLLLPATLDQFSCVWLEAGSSSSIPDAHYWSMQTSHELGNMFSPKSAFILIVLELEQG